MIYDFYSKAKAGARAFSNLLTGMDGDRNPSLGSSPSTSKESLLPQNTTAGPPVEKTPVLSTTSAGQHAKDGLLGKATATHAPTLSKPPVLESAAKRLSDTAFGAEPPDARRWSSKVMRAARKHVEAGIEQVQLQTLEAARPFVTTVMPLSRMYA